jgi:hypothetical protein
MTFAIVPEATPLQANEKLSVGVLGYLRRVMGNVTNLELNAND